MLNNYDSQFSSEEVDVASTLRSLVTVWYRARPENLKHFKIFVSFGSNIMKMFEVHKYITGYYY